MVGQTLGKYSITEQIGCGGMGEVYLAMDQSLRRKVALKLIQRFKHDERSRQRFVSEARLAAAVQHPFICKIHEVGEQDGTDYICMEFVEGKTLSEELRSKGALAFPKAVRLALEMCEAMITAHGAGIIHRDLKPSNIMLASDGHVRILDFGIAQRAIPTDEETLTVFGLTDPGQVAGTIGYMSPEQLLKRPLDGRSDIFALGVVFYEVVSGSHPFRRATSLETALATVNDAPPPLSRFRTETPEWFERMLERMLAKDAEERYESVRAVRAALEAQSETRVPVPLVSRQPPFIVVLPLANSSGDPEQEFFSEGVTDDIIAKLCKLTVLRVVGRTSGRRYNLREQGAACIGEELGVSHILEGSVRRAGHRVRINVGLIEVQSLRQIWGEVYDGSLEDVFAIQSEVAGNVAAALEKTFAGSAEDGAQSSSTDEPIGIETYELYLKGRFFLNRPMPENITKAIHCLELVAEARPRYARAWAGLAACYASAGHYGYLPPVQAYPKARQAALRSIELNKNTAEALTWLAFVKGYYDWDWPGAEACYERALRADANSVETLVHYSRFLCVRRKFDRAVTLVERAVKLDPLAPMVNTVAGWVLAMAGRLAQAMPYFERALEIDPAFGMARTCRAMAYAGMGEYEKAIEETRKWSWSPTFLGIAYGFAGRMEEARGIAADVSRPDAKLARPSEIALIWLLAGDREKAAEWLDRAVAERDYMLGLLVCPAWNPVRGDPLVENALRQMGLEFSSPALAGVA